jgi:CBS domain-containing protein
MTPNAFIERVARLMAGNQVDRLPILDEDNPVTSAE